MCCPLLILLLSIYAMFCTDLFQLYFSFFLSFSLIVFVLFILYVDRFRELHAISTTPITINHTQFPPIFFIFPQPPCIRGWSIHWMRFCVVSFEYRITFNLPFGRIRLNFRIQFHIIHFHVFDLFEKAKKINDRWTFWVWLIFSFNWMNESIHCYVYI